MILTWINFWIIHSWLIYFKYIEDFLSAYLGIFIFYHIYWDSKFYIFYSMVQNDDWACWNNFLRYISGQSSWLNCWISELDDGTGWDHIFECVHDKLFYCVYYKNGISCETLWFCCLLSHTLDSLYFFIANTCLPDVLIRKNLYE